MHTKLFHRLNGAVGACRYADAVAVAFCSIYDGFTVYQLYRFFGAGFDAFKRAPAFFLIDDYFHRVVLFSCYGVLRQISLKRVFMVFARYGEVTSKAFRSAAPEKKMTVSS